MKKGIVLLASLICAFTVGCTSAKEEKVESLKDAYFNIEKKLEKKDSELLNIYNEISKDIGNNKDVNISDIKKMTDIKPSKEDTFDPTMSKDVTYYSFKKEKDVMGVYCLKGEYKARRVFFGVNNDPIALNKLGKSKTDNFMKGAFGIGYFEGRQEVLLDVSMDVDSLATQEKVLNLIFE